MIIIYLAETVSVGIADVVAAYVDREIATIESLRGETFVIARDVHGWMDATMTPDTIRLHHNIRDIVRVLTMLER